MALGEPAEIRRATRRKFRGKKTPAFEQGLSLDPNGVALELLTISVAERLERVMRRHLESSAFVDASPGAVFAFVDDHSRFSSHMNQSSWMMGGGRMSVELDERDGQAVGSHIRLSGRVFGIRLYLDEVVTRRDPPVDKIWETVGMPRLLVIGAYTMGVQITPVSGASRMRVFIDYELPNGRATYWLGLLFSRFYAKWCINQMLKGTVESFGSRHPAAA